MSRDTENEKKLLVATTGTTSLKYKDMEQRSSKPDGYHGYHERSRDEVGLQVDSKVGSRQESSVAGLRSQVFETGKVKSGGQGRNRTADASLFRAALYRLSYLAANKISF